MGTLRRRAAVKADAKVMREKRLRRCGMVKHQIALKRPAITECLCDRATRRPEESLEDLLIKSRDQAEAWHFHRDGLSPILVKLMRTATLWIWRRWTIPPVETLMRRERWGYCIGKP